MAHTLKPDGGPAFPDAAAEYNGNIARPGMSLRQYYIGQALAGLCANPEWSAHLRRNEPTNQEARLSTIYHCVNIVDELMDEMKARGEL